MLTWCRIWTRRDRFGCTVVSQSAVTVVGESSLGGDHRGGDPPPVVGRRWRQVRYTRLRMWMMMMGRRVDRVVMPRCRVRRVVAPALGEALVAARDRRVGRGAGRGTTGGGRGRCGAATRVVRFVVGSTGSTGSSGRRARRSR